MANVASVNVYQINQIVLPRNAPIRYAFPTQGCILQDVSNSPNRSLSSGYNVYGLIMVPTGNPAQNSYNEYYTAETLAQLVTLWG